MKIYLIKTNFYLKILRNYFLRKKSKIRYFLFSFVGRIAKDKGIFELILAFKQHVKYYPDSLKIIIGFNEIGKEFLDKIKNVHNIIFLGFQSDIHLYLNCFDTFVLPSHREGFGWLF